MEGGLFYVDTSGVEVKREVAVRDGDLRQLPRKKHTVDLKTRQFSEKKWNGAVVTHVSTLRSILIARIRGHTNVVQSHLVILPISMLPQ